MEDKARDRMRRMTFTQLVNVADLMKKDEDKTLTILEWRLYHSLNGDLREEIEEREEVIK